MNTKKQIPIILLIGLIVTLVLTVPLSAKSKAYLGVYLNDIPESKYEKYGIKGHYGVLIQKVIKDSPAKEAGLKSKDVILNINGEKVYTHDQITKMLSNYEPEQVIKITILRDGKEKNFKVTLGKKKGLFGEKSKAYLGVYLKDLSDEDYEEIGLDENYGVLVSEVVEGGPAEKADIEDDDVIMEIEKDKIYTSDQLSKMLYNYEPEQEVKVLIFRSGDKKTYNVKLGEKEVEFFDFQFGSDFNWFLGLPTSVFMYKYLDENGKWIGIIIEDINEQMLKSYEISNGVLIKEIVEGSPAEDSELNAGDVIIDIDGELIYDTNDIQDIIEDMDVDDYIILKIKRDDEFKTIKTKIGEREDYDKKEKVEITIDEGDVRLIIDGEETDISNLNKYFLGLEDIKDLKKFEKLEALEELKELKNLEKLEKLKNIQIDIETGTDDLRGAV